MAVPLEPGSATGRQGRPAFLSTGDQAAMKTPEGKSPSTQSLEPDAARIPLLKQSTSKESRWNCPQGKGPSTQVPGVGEARDRLMRGNPQKAGHYVSPG